MRNAKFSEIACLISCCSIHVGQLRWFAWFTSCSIILPAYQSPPNKWQKAERKWARNLVSALSPGAIVERLSFTTLQYCMYWKRMECQLYDQHKVKSTSRVFGNGPVQTAPLLEFFETTLDHCSNPKKSWGFNSVIWWPITREFIFPNAFTRS